MLYFSLVFLMQNAIDSLQKARSLVDQVKCDRICCRCHSSNARTAHRHLLAQWHKIVRVARNLAMSVVVSDEILTVTRMTEAEMRQEIAVMLFQREKLTLAQASRFAGMHRVAFQHLLASRRISVHYGVEDFEQDIQNLREMGRL
nr:MULTISPECIES: UPF0175 family protein [unclassified Coleofasciculus]